MAMNRLANAAAIKWGLIAVTIVVLAFGLLRTLAHNWVKRP